MAKSSVIPIIKDHFATLRDERTGRLSSFDLILFYLVPLIPAVIVAWQAWDVRGLAILLTALSLLAGLLFNLLVLLFDAVVRTSASNTEMAKHQRRLVQQVQSNVTYAVVIALTCTAILGIVAMAGGDRLPGWLSPVIVFLLGHFLLLLGMILKRIRAMFLNELREWT